MIRFLRDAYTQFGKQSGVTSLAFGEEGGNGPPMPTTLALNEEGGGNQVSKKTIDYLNVWREADANGDRIGGGHSASPSSFQHPFQNPRGDAMLTKQELDAQLGRYNQHRDLLQQFKDMVSGTKSPFVRFVDQLRNQVLGKIRVAERLKVNFDTIDGVSKPKNGKMTIFEIIDTAYKDKNVNDLSDEDLGIVI